MLWFNCKVEPQNIVTYTSYLPHTTLLAHAVRSTGHTSFSSIVMYIKARYTFTVFYTGKS